MKAQSVDHTATGIDLRHRSSGKSFSAASRFAPVGTDEIAFAITLFVGAGSSQVPWRPFGSNDADRRSRQKCLSTLTALSAGIAEDTKLSNAGISHEQPLSKAFATVWQNYEGQALQTSICARVLGFYYLMELSSGTIVHRWASPCQEDAEKVLLHPAIVEALAAVPLDESGRLSEGRFLLAMEATSYS